MSKMIRYLITYFVYLSTDEYSCNHYSIKTRRFQLLDSPKNNQKQLRVTINEHNFDSELTIKLKKGGSYKANYLKKKELEFRTNLFMAKNPGISRGEVKIFMESFRDGIDLTFSKQPATLYEMDLNSQFKRAQAYSSCAQTEEFKDKDPNKVFRKMVKTHFEEDGCIPTDVLEKAAGMRRKRYNSKLDRLNDTLYNGNFFVKKQKK